MSCTVSHRLTRERSGRLTNREERTESEGFFLVRILDLSRGTPVRNPKSSIPPPRKGWATGRSTNHKPRFWTTKTLKGNLNAGSVTSFGPAQTMHGAGRTCADHRGPDTAAFQTWPPPKQYCSTFSGRPEGDQHYGPSVLSDGRIILRFLS